MNRKDITRHKKRKKNKLKLLFWGILFAFVAVLVMYLFSLGGKSIGEILSYKNYWLSVGVANGLILIGYLMMYRVDAQNIALNENDLEDTEWLSVKRLKKLKEFQVYDYKSAEQKTDGIVIGAEKKGGSVEVITTSQLHALIVGTTGSGKTTGFVDQNIAVLGKSKGKPSIVISDPKKELYEKHARTLEKEGYKISVLDLREPYSSERWNPMNVLLRRTQMYKELVEKANLNLRRNQTETAILKRNTYFVLDEFANLPKFENIEGMVTVARSRGIRFLFVLQSYSQLTAKYGRDVGDIIKTNCNVKIFIGSDDSETRKEFSELCGQKKIKQFSVNTNADNPASSNTGATLQPLISVGMLERLNGDEKGDAIVSVRGYEPIWTVFTPSYELKKVYFPEGKAAIGKREAVLFEKENYVFDITGDVGQKIEDKLSELIEEQEAEEARADENDKAKRVARLTKQWDDVEAELQRVVDNICVYLDGKDEKAVRQAAYEHKVRLLLAITEHYNRSIANEIRVAADKIQLELLPRMKEYQEQATK